MAHILIVDDNVLCRLALRASLEAFGHRIGDARNGFEAMAACRRERPDLVLLDILMPEKDGIETIREIRADHPWLPVVAMSDGGRLSDDHYLKMMRHLGANDVLRKPFGLDHLVVVVTKLLPQDSTAPAD